MCDFTVTTLVTRSFLSLNFTHGIRKNVTLGNVEEIQTNFIKF